MMLLLEESLKKMFMMHFCIKLYSSKLWSTMYPSHLVAQQAVKVTCLY